MAMNVGGLHRQQPRLAGPRQSANLLRSGRNLKCDLFLLVVQERDRTFDLPDCRSFLIRSEEHTSELQSHSFISYAVFCLKKKNKNHHTPHARPFHSPPPTSHLTTHD